MSDLISRSALIKVLNTYKFGFLTNEVEREYAKEVIISFVETEPTAYDMEKVVAELEEEGKCYARYSVNTDGVKSVPTYKAIEIVRKGGAEC